MDEFIDWHQNGDGNNQLDKLDLHDLAEDDDEADQPLIPAGVSNTATLFARQMTLPSIVFFAAFIYFFAQSRVGNISRYVTTRTLVHFWNAVRWTFRESGRSIPSSVSRRIINFIRSDVIASSNLSICRPRAQVTLDHIVDIIKFLLGPAPALRSVQARFSMITIILYLLVTNNRVGSVLKAVSTDESRSYLKWSDVRLVVRKGPPELNNDLSIEFTTPNGKSDESKNIPVVLRQDEESLILCPVLFFLVLA